MQGSAVSLAALGDVTDINCHSNIPYFFFNEGVRQKFVTDPVRLDLRTFTWPRRLWNLKQFLTGKGIGGYQYSQDFLDEAEKQIPLALLKGLMISISQVFPRVETIQNKGGRIIYYIDATLKDLADNPSYNFRLPPHIISQAIEQERKNYEGAEYVATRSSWIIPTLTDFYKIDRSKIVHIPPGANISLPEGWKFPIFRPAAGLERELILGFVGKDWKRKGLPFLVDVRNKLVQRGFKVRIKAIGNCPEDLRDSEGLSFTGFIDKHREMNKFIEELSSCDLGCLFSDSEGFGISILEFLRVGVPVAGLFHQGLKDSLLEGASFRFKFPSTADEVADIFQAYISNDDQQREMKTKAIEYSKTVTWETCIASFRKLAE